jgi:hypothetical protein
MLMGLFISFLHNLFNFFVGFSRENYLSVEDKTNSDKQENKNRLISIMSDQPQLHRACRSTDKHKLVSYQSRIDNLNVGEVVYVI